MTAVTPSREEIARVICDCHRTHVRQPSRSGEPRRTFHQGELEAADRILALIAADAGEGWRGIESAPREIEYRCLLAHKYSVVTGYWDGEGWRNERSRLGGYFVPTHWRPLPAASIPEAAKEAFA